MKQFIILALAIVGLTFGQTYYHNTASLDKGVLAKVLTDEAIAEFVVDVAIDSGEIGYSRSYDLKLLPLKVLESGTVASTMTRGDSILLVDTTDGGIDSISYYAGTQTTAGTVTGSATQSLDGGDLTYSCYDVDGTAGDSTHVQVITQVSAYGADGYSPYKAKSDAWTTLHTDSVVGESASSALVEDTRDLTFTDESARFIRWKLTNYTGDANDDVVRCRVYWTRKKRI
jgi:hypothetical protein